MQDLSSLDVYYKSNIIVNEMLLDRIREELPEAILRTTLIVGFPGETQEQFDHLVSFVEAQCFDHVGIFTFSPEEGTRAADLPDFVPIEIAEARKDKLISIQQPISEARNRTWIGRSIDVLIEEVDINSLQMTGRCSRFAPEVDGEVILSSLSQPIIKPGTMVRALVTGANLYDLTAEVVS